MLKLLLFLFINVLYGQSNIPPSKAYYFTQKLDHFNAQDVRTFQQRYLMYDYYWDRLNNAPILFYAGNEGPITDFYNNTGFMFDIAPQFRGLVLFCEHRYYGETQPFGNDYSTKNLQWLNMAQAIADYAVFIEYIKKAYNVTSKVIVFGGSYGGILAGLLRIHYKSQFDMALAASAPVLQTMDKTDPTVFWQLITQDYYNVNTKCPDIVRAGYAQLIELKNQGSMFITRYIYMLNIL